MKLPPIVGAQPLPMRRRPNCCYCLTPLRPCMTQNWTPKESGGTEPTSRTFRGVYGYLNVFCGPRCAEHFGVHAVAKHIEKIKKQLADGTFRENQ